jgi:hypothetical protein
MASDRETPWRTGILKRLWEEAGALKADPKSLWCSHSCFLKGWSAHLTLGCRSATIRCNDQAETLENGDYT